MKAPPENWDPRREKEIRRILAELHALEDAGRFDDPSIMAALAPPAARKAEEGREEGRGRLVAKRISLLRTMDSPVDPALARFMTQLTVQERTAPYKEENRRKFEEAVGQVRILFGKIARGEVNGSEPIRAIMGSFMDTFMKDRNLLVNLAAHPYHGPDYLYDHSLKLCLLSLAIASAAGYSRGQAIEIAQGALLADVGMMLVPDRIRLKRGRLIQGEVFEIQKHPILGLALLEPVRGLSDISLIIPYQHHERLSGGGYPDRRSGAAVSRYSRIVGIADVFTALINKRSYREALIPYNAMVAVLSMGGQGLLDGGQIRNFLRALSIFPLGSLVRLSSGRIGKVVAPNQGEFTKPLVSVLTAENGAILPKNRIIQLDLATSPAESIIEALPGNAIRNSILDGF